MASLKAKAFRAEVLDGHKGAAVLVPFDPTQAWGIAAKPLWKGRRGHTVRGTVNGAPIESAIVGRSKQFYLLLSASDLDSARAAVGEQVSVRIAPRADAQPG